MFPLKSVIEDTAGVYLVIDRETGDTRAATSLEVELWQYATAIKAPHRETYMRVNEADLLRLMQELDQVRDEIKLLRARLLEKGR